MLNTKLFRHAFVLLFLIGILYFLSILFYLSWTVWWYDTVLHFLGGVCVAMAVLSLRIYSYSPVPTNKLKIIGIAVVGVLVIGIIWEIYELYFGLTFLSDGIIYIRDTSSDIIMDISGGFFGSLYSIRLLNK